MTSKEFEKQATTSAGLILTAFVVPLFFIFGNWTVGNYTHKDLFLTLICDYLGCAIIIFTAGKLTTIFTKNLHILGVVIVTSILSLAPVISYIIKNKFF